MAKDELAEALISEVCDSQLKERRLIAEILKRSAARDLTMLEIEASSLDDHDSK